MSFLAGLVVEEGWVSSIGREKIRWKSIRTKIEKKMVLLSIMLAALREGSVTV
jgi:hypothetical protein